MPGDFLCLRSGLSFLCCYFVPPRMGTNPAAPPSIGTSFSFGHTVGIGLNFAFGHWFGSGSPFACGTATGGIWAKEFSLNAKSLAFDLESAHGALNRWSRSIGALVSFSVELRPRQSKVFNVCSAALVPNCPPPNSNGHSFRGPIATLPPDCALPGRFAVDWQKTAVPGNKNTATSTSRFIRVLSTPMILSVASIDRAKAETHR